MTISVRVDDELARRFEAYQKRSGQTSSDAARMLLAIGLEHSRGPAAVSALALQSKVCAALSQEWAGVEQRLLRVLRTSLSRA